MYNIRSGDTSHVLSATILSLFIIILIVIRGLSDKQIPPKNKTGSRVILSSWTIIVWGEGGRRNERAEMRREERVKVKRKKERKKERKKARLLLSLPLSIHLAPVIIQLGKSNDWNTSRPTSLRLRHLLLLVSPPPLPRVSHAHLLHTHRTLSRTDARIHAPHAHEYLLSFSPLFYLSLASILSFFFFIFFIFFPPSRPSFLQGALSIHLFII